mmetsp:Transcript_11973/g.25302  ORF Transcript_11973/g.25302 Transcript_11973/m.25302 type:complete len:83 (+) Transcript_11973:91-339(+)
MDPAVMVVYRAFLWYSTRGFFLRLPSAGRVSQTLSPQSGSPDSYYDGHPLKYCLGTLLANIDHVHESIERSVPTRGERIRSF